MFRGRQRENKPICGCKHHWSFHDERGVCHHTEVVTAKQFVVQRDKDQNPIINAAGNPSEIMETVVVYEENCRCQRYYGPEPLPSYVVPALAER